MTNFAGSHKQLLAGVIPPMMTPLTEAGAVDTAAVERLVAYMIDNGVDGLFALGSTGEGSWLTFEQQRQLVEATLAANAGRVPVLVGVLEPSTVKVVETARRWQGYDIDALVVTTPYYFGVDAESIEWHFRTVAAATAFPLLAYNIPSMTHNTLTPGIMRRLLDVQNIVGIKDSAGDWQAFTGFLALHDQRPDFRVFQGNERLATQSLLAGADGVVPGMGNLIPQVFAALFERAQAGDTAETAALQAQVDSLWYLHGHGYWLTCLKYAASLLSFGGGVCSGHVGALTPEAKTAIADLMTPYLRIQT